MWRVCGRREIHAGFWCGNMKERRPLGRWEDDIEMGLEEVEWKDTGWIHVICYRARGRVVVNTVMNTRVS